MILVLGLTVNKILLISYNFVQAPFFFEALANLHTTMERHIRRKNGESNVPEAFDHPGVNEGVEGMKFVRAAVNSSKKKGAWTKL